MTLCALPISPYVMESLVTSPPSSFTANFSGLVLSWRSSPAAPVQTDWTAGSHSCKAYYCTLEEKNSPVLWIKDCTLYFTLFLFLITLTHPVLWGRFVIFSLFQLSPRYHTKVSAKYGWCFIVHKIWRTCLWVMKDVAAPTCPLIYLQKRNKIWTMGNSPRGEQKYVEVL